MGGKREGNLSEEGDGLLVQLLGVSNVAVDDFREGQPDTVNKILLVFLSLDRELTTDSVLGVPQRLVHVVQTKDLSMRSWEER